MKTSLLLLLLAASPAMAQKTVAPKATPAKSAAAKVIRQPAGPVPVFSLDCATDPPPAGPLQKTYCEIRNLTLAAPPADMPLTVDARTNGSISVRAWAGTDVRVRARVTGKGATAETARALATAVRLGATAHTVRAALANGSVEGWAVSYEVLVPAQTNLVLTAVNGALTLENVRGQLRLTTTNGPLVLRGVSGDVRAQTTNGRIDLSLNGETWTGPGLDVSTVNGDINWELPAEYTATVLARTTRGRVAAELNTKRLNLLPHNLAATLGKGGAQLKVSTTNGNVRVTQPRPTPAAAPDSLDAE
ncbi:DUF4097 family beta strand repeat-containing protein [Hymenobacter lapidiphilus]|uniref:DUF4097 family beta strand repeat protein n=1 Tax=Hymenobacter lapidiphilus TaxID=2608003 RepID=A0A7Y7U6V0_9BACT|nr:DUF4097 family beta strand repeat-containing protein [Hymenobacter lapidiphilus]NVO32174.1 DUF4097 family beta strand repeat protein [Hymenobacter lapidiphilus]